MADLFLYAALGGSDVTSDLYIATPSVGDMNSIGPIGFALTGLALDPTTDILYGSTSANSANNPRSIITIDRDTGEGTLVGATGLSQPVGDISFDAAGNMYGWRAGTNSRLVSINKATGVATVIGSTTTSGGAVEFVGADLYWFSQNLGDFESTVNLGTGALTPVVVMSGDAPGTSGSAYNSETLVMYLCGFGHFYSIDLVTGVVTFLSSTGLNLDAIAWAPLPPQPPPSSFANVRALPTVRLFVTNLVSRTLSVLDNRTTNKEFLWTLNQPAYHTGQVGSDDHITNQPFPDADSPSVVSNNVSLIYALQRWPNATPPYQPIWGGILFTVEDEGSDAPTTRYTAFDPWQLMMSRPVRNPDTDALPGVDGLKFPPDSRASDIALALLVTSEANEGESHIDFSDLGLVDDTAPLPYGIKFDQGSTVGDAWQQLVDTGTIDIVLTPMYEPITAPGKVVRFNTNPSYGSIRYSATMGWDTAGHGVAQMSRMVDGTRLANRVRNYAGQGGLPVPLQSDAASIALYGIYYAQQFFPGTLDRQRVELLALADLQIRKDGARSITLDVAPERSLLAVRDYWLGDYVGVWASMNLRDPLGVDYDTFDPDFPYASGYQRIYAIPMSVDDNGVSRVTGMVTSRDVAVGS